MAECRCFKCTGIWANKSSIDWHRDDEPAWLAQPETFGQVQMDLVHGLDGKPGFVFWVPTDSNTRDYIGYWADGKARWSGDVFQTEEL
jgi:hypothetical protein